MFHKIFQFGLALGLLLLFGWVAWIAITNTASYLAAADANVAAAIIGTAGTALASVVAILLAQYFSRKRDFLEAHRAQKSEIYSEFIGEITSLLRKSQEDESFDVEKDPKFIDAIHGFHRQILLWASPSVIQAWSKFRIGAVTESAESVLLMDDLIQSMRKDVGVSNSQLNRGDIIKVLLSDPEELDRILEGS